MALLSDMYVSWFVGSGGHQTESKTPSVVTGKSLDSAKIECRQNVEKMSKNMQELSKAPT